MLPKETRESDDEYFYTHLVTGHLDMFNEVKSTLFDKGEENGN